MGRRIDLQTDCSGNGGNAAPELDEATEHEPVTDSRFAGGGIGGVKRPVSMFEPRDSPYNNHNHHNHSHHHPKVSSIPESRTTSSMYQMADQANKQSSSLPASEEVKHRTDVVTRRIQELWSVVQDQVRDAFVPCAERIRVAIEELTAIFPMVRFDRMTVVCVDSQPFDRFRLRRPLPMRRLPWPCDS